MVTSLGHSGADSSSTASRPVRSASSISPSVRMCSQPAALMWPRNEFGIRAALHLAVGDGGGLHAAAGVHDHLLDRRTVR